MKICRYQNVKTPGIPGRLGILTEDQKIIDPNWALAIEYERMGYPNPFERANHHLPSSLYQLLNLVNSPIERLQEGFSMDEFLKILGVTQSHKGLHYKFDAQSSDIKFLCPIDHIPVYRDFYVHEKHVKKGFEKRNGSLL